MFDEKYHNIVKDEITKKDYKEMLKKIEGKEGDGYKAFAIALESVIILANRYADIAAEQAKTASDERKAQLEIIEKTLRKVPENGAENL